MNNQSSPQTPKRYMDFAPRGKRPATRPTPRPAARPAPKPTRPTPLSRPVAQPAPRPQVQFTRERIEAKQTILYPSQQRPTSSLIEEDGFLDIETSGLGIIEDSHGSTATDAPDNSKFVFGGSSPFINTDKVNKRPLSSHLPKQKSATKNNYAKREKVGAKSAKSTPTMVTTSASRGSNLSLIIAITLTVIFGAVVGAFVYLAFFQ